MAFEGTDFEDTDYAKPRASATPGRAPTREELDSQLTGTQQQLAKLRETQEQLERARVALEEMRRRRAEFSAGLTDMRQQLTRGEGLLQKAELDARREAEQLARTLSAVRGSLDSLAPLSDAAWTDENWEQELTRGLTAIENARLEFNAARLKWPILDGTATTDARGESAGGLAAWTDLSTGQLMRIGFALTWPLVLVVAIAAGAAILLVLRH